jgi:hypothetical protein
MSEQIELKVNDETPQALDGGAMVVAAAKVEQQQKKMTLKGILMMAACCAAPILLLAAIPFLGATFGSLAATGSGMLSIVALLACPVGMYLMMRMMMKDKH